MLNTHHFTPPRLVILAIGCVIAVTGMRCAPRSDTQGADASASVQAADLVLRGGAIYTVDAKRSWARAIAVRNGKITYVGSDEGVKSHIGSGTKVINLEDRMVLPGFQDIHIHPIYGGLQALSCDLSALETQEQYVEAVAAYAAKHPDKPWILGGGWSMSAFQPGGITDRQLLDAVVPDRPVLLTSADGHTSWVNSKALEIAGITRDTPDPAGGRIDRDPATGEAIGSLQEFAGDLVREHAPPYTLEATVKGLKYALDMVNRYGITAFQDAGVDMEGLQGLDAYRQLDESGELTARVVASLWWDKSTGEEQVSALLEKRERYTKGRLSATTVKIMQDGVMENQTAALLEPYVGKPGVTGFPMVDPQKLKQYVTRLDDEGFQIHFHAIGDAAIRQSLDAIEAARKKNGNRGNRHHISHIQLFHPADIPRFRELDVVANFQPLWALADEYITDMTIPFLGPERSRWLYPIGSLVASGAVVAFGSDWSVSTANPLEEIEVALTRMGPNGETKEPLLPEERIDLPTALAAFTINAAYVNSLEKETGSIEVGKFADLIVLDRNLFTIEPSEISESKVLLTLLEGEPMYGNLSL
ncbi:MAG: amidohydrolase [Acidobacteriota bacterium]